MKTKSMDTLAPTGGNVFEEALARKADAAESGSDIEMGCPTTMELDVDLDDLFGEVENNAFEDEAELKKKNKKKRKRKVIAERELQQLEDEGDDWSHDPKTVEEFERLLLTENHSAAVWIRYMAHWLQLSNLPKAREIAERGVSQIAFSEGLERENLWVAYLNMECVYGDQCSFDACFKRAVQYSKPKHLMIHVSQMYERQEKYNILKAFCAECCQKFPKSLKLWDWRIGFHFRRANQLSGKMSGHAVSLKDHDELLRDGRKFFVDALKRIPTKDKQTRLAANVGRLEYQFGSIERGQGIFDNLLGSHPKRVDVWCQYFDVHVSAHTPPRVSPANVESVRRVFRRASSLDLRPFKMKGIFTRWLAFEKSHGTIEGQEAVQEEARNFVMNHEKKHEEHE